MLRRNEPGGGDPSSPPQGPATYAALRSQALEVARGSLGPAPSGIDREVFGVVMDLGYPQGSATLVALADGTGSMYTSSGGGVIGGGFHKRVASACGWLVSTAQAHLPAFDQSADLGLPRPGFVRISLLTDHGQRTILAREDDLGGGRHRASAVFFAAHQVITALRRAEEGPAPSAAPKTLANGVTRLMGAAAHGRAGEVWALIDEGDEVEARDDIGYTALMYAANGGHEEAARALLERGADPNAADDQRSTPLMFAAQGGHLGIVRLLLDAGADPRPAGTHGLTALGFARQNGHQATAGALAKAGGV